MRYCFCFLILFSLPALAVGRLISKYPDKTILHPLKNRDIDWANFKLLNLNITDSIPFTVFGSQTITAVEICNNNIDDDGDGAIDGFDPECYMPASCPGNYGENIFSEGTFGTVSKNGMYTIQPIPENNPGVIIGNPLPNGFNSYFYGLNVDYKCKVPGKCIPGTSSYVIANSTNGMQNTPSVDEGSAVWSEFSDNSTDPEGYMMLVDASQQLGNYYKETVTGLCSNSSYRVSIDVRNLFAANWKPNGPDNYFSGYVQVLPNIDFVVAPIGTSDAALEKFPKAFNTGDIMNDDKWHTFSFNFIPPPGVTSVIVAIRNNAPADIGNDLAIDNISFRPCGPLATAKYSSTSPACKNASGSFTANLSTGYNSPVVQWQKKKADSTWSDIAGAVQLNYPVANLSLADSGVYRIVAAEAGNINNNKCRVTSNKVNLLVKNCLENCTNGIDDDGDGLIDNNDPDCCPTITEPVYNVNPVCQNQNVTINKTGLANGTFFWYRNFKGGAPLSNNFTISKIQKDSVLYLVDSNTVTKCTSPRHKVLILVNPSPMPIASNNNPACFGDLLSLSASGGVSYKWTGPNNFTSNNQNPSLIALNNTYSGKYEVTITTAAQCSAIAFTVVPNLQILPVLEQISTEVCEKQSILLKASNVGGSVTWTSPSGFNFTGFQFKIDKSKYSDNGIYTVKLLNGTCSRNNLIDVKVKNCPPKATEDFYSVNSKEKLIITLQDHPVANDLDPNDVLNTQNFKILTQPIHGSLTMNPDKTFVYTPQKYNGEEILEYEICDTGLPVLCTISKITISVHDKGLFIPDAFTPNGDGINDNFVIFNLKDGAKVNLSVFNRWGDIVYRSEEYKNDWKGLSNSGFKSGNELPASTYYIVAEVSSGEKVMKQVTLTR